MPQYVIVQPNPETLEFGYTGKLIYNLIKENKPHLYQQMKEENSLIPIIQKWEEQFKAEMLSLMDSRKNQSEAREIAWPEITAQFGM